MEPPVVMLSDSVLVNILADSYILSAAFNQTAGATKDSISDAYRQQIFDKYEITQEILDENVEWRYAQEEMDTIFNRMMDRLNYLELHISSDSDLKE